jgi:hypothetical protein
VLFAGGTIYLPTSLALYPIAALLILHSVLAVSSYQWSTKRLEWKPSHTFLLRPFYISQQPRSVYHDAVTIWIFARQTHHLPPHLAISRQALHGRVTKSPGEGLRSRLTSPTPTNVTYLVGMKLRPSCLLNQYCSSSYFSTPKTST